MSENIKRQPKNRAPQTIEQWLDANAPEWVQEAYRKQTREIIERLQTAESRLLVRQGDQVVEATVGPGETQGFNSPNGFPVPKEVAEDPHSVEILRVWLHHDGNCAHAIAPYALETANDWGMLFGNIADNYVQDRHKADPELCASGMMGLLLKGFIDAAGIPVAVVRQPPMTHTAPDPDDLPN